MSRPLRLIPLVLLFACGKGDETGAPPPEETGDTDIDTDTDTDTDPPPVEHCPALGAATGATVVQPGGDIVAALADAKTGDVIALAAGTHNITESLVVTTPGITLRGETGNPDDVIVQGINVTTMVHVAASDFTLAGLTLKNGAHAVLVEPIDADVNNTLIDTVKVLDQGHRNIIIRGDATQAWFPDGGEIRCSDIHLTDAGRKKVLGICETGGIQLHHARGWTLRDNDLGGFWCRFATGKWGIEVSEGARDVVIERNVIRDTVQGIALGRGVLVTAREWDDAPCEGSPLHAVSTVARNNILYTWDQEIFQDAEVKPQLGITIENSCDAVVLHNTIYSREPHAQASLLMRFANTTGVVANNLTNGTVRRQDGAQSIVSKNIEHAGDQSFMHPHGEDFHLAPAATDLIDHGDPEHTVEDDVDGELRHDGLPDIGADER